MSFSSEVKSELCSERPERKCIAIAESYGVLLYCNTFTEREIRIITTSSDFSHRLVRLFRKAFGLSFDVVPEEGAGGKLCYIMNNPDKIALIFDAFGEEPDMTLSHHVNFGVLDEEGCREAFIRGAFLAGGTVTDPEKRFHLEISTSHKSVSRETAYILMELGVNAKESSRGANSLLYLKQADAIADFLALIGASNAGMSIVTAKVDKEMRNIVTRQINCDSANADKTVAAAQTQIDAIHKIAREYGLDALPEPLKDAALLRITNPEASLADLARLSMPPVTKSCLSHRLKKIVEFAQEEEKE